MTKKRSNVITINSKYVINENKRRKRDAKINKIARYRTLLIFSICMISLLYVFSNKKDQEEIYEEKVAMNQQLEEEVAELKETEAELQQSIEKLSDPEYLAKVARDEYYLSGEGEIVFLVPDENDSEQDVSSEAATSETSDSETTSEDSNDTQEETVTEGSETEQEQSSESP